MPSVLMRCNVRFVLATFMLLVQFVWGSENFDGPIFASPQPSFETHPDVSPEPSFGASTEPSLEAELSPMTMSELINKSYMRQVDFIRQGLPMSLVTSFYNHVLKEAARPECILVGGNAISGRCTTPLLDEGDGYAVKALQELISVEDGRSITEKYFPDLSTRKDLPALTGEGHERLNATMVETEQGLTQGAAKGWEVAVFPKDEEIRFDRGRNASCTELAEKMPYTALTMSASSLTAFVFGMAAQIIVTNGDSPQARMILDNHVKLMYLAARCNRLSGEELQVPTQQLNDLIRRSQLALITTSIGPSETGYASLPLFDAMKDVVEGSRHFFNEEIERMTSMNSFGKINYLSWTGNTVTSETLDYRMAGKVTLQMLIDYFGSRNASIALGPCKEGYSSQIRIAHSHSPGESCCAETCIISSGRVLDVFIVNEMCCTACNEAKCDLNKLARVISVEAFRFSRSEVA